MKPYVEFNTQKRKEVKRKGAKDGKLLYILTSNAVHRKTTEKLRNRIDSRPVNNKKDNLKWTSKPNFVSQKKIDNDLVAVRKSKVTLTFYRPAYSGVHLLDLSKVLMYEFHYDYIENKYGNNSRLLFTDTDKLKPKMFMKILARMKNCLILAITLLSQNTMMIKTNYLLVR